MNPRSDRVFPNSSEPLDQSGSPSQAGLTVDPEVDLWGPPFERWLRLADDLLRDWPHGPLPEHRA
jgi:hypothetical protein